MIQNEVNKTIIAVQSALIKLKITDQIAVTALLSFAGAVTKSHNFSKEEFITLALDCWKNTEYSWPDSKIH